MFTVDGLSSHVDMISHAELKLRTPSWVWRLKFQVEETFSLFLSIQKWEIPSCKLYSNAEVHHSLHLWQFMFTDLQSHRALFNMIRSQTRMGMPILSFFSNSLLYFFPFIQVLKEYWPWSVEGYVIPFFHFVSSCMKVNMCHIVDCNSMIESECACMRVGVYKMSVIVRKALKLFQLKVLFEPKTKNKR